MKKWNLEGEKEVKRGRFGINPTQEEKKSNADGGGKKRSEGWSEGKEGGPKKGYFLRQAKKSRIDSEQYPRAKKNLSKRRTESRNKKGKNLRRM